MAHDVFISYSSADKPIADAVCEGLELRGFSCWIAPRDIVPGLDWGAAIIDAITEARVMVLIYSSSANQSKQIKREVERAVAKGVSIIPLRIEDVPLGKTLEYFISSEHWMDALTRPLEPHVERLAAAIRALLARPSRAGEAGVHTDRTRLPEAGSAEPLRSASPLPPPPRPATPPPPPPPNPQRAAALASSPATPPEPHAEPAPRSGPPRVLVIGGLAAGAALLLLSLLLRGSPPQILSVQFPQQIVAGAGYASGIVHFRARKSDIAMARFDVAQATSFTPFSFPVAGAGRREGGIAFSVQSPIPQRVTLRAVLVDRDGRVSNPVPFTFDVQPAPAAVPRRRDGRGVEFQAPNGFRFRVPR